MNHYRVYFCYVGPDGEHHVWDCLQGADGMLDAIRRAYAARPARFTVANGFRALRVQAELAPPESVPPLRCEHQGAQHDDQPRCQPDQQQHPRVERRAPPGPRHARQ